jgi:hypothetical protein
MIPPEVHRCGAQSSRAIDLLRRAPAHHPRAPGVRGQRHRQTRVAVVDEDRVLWLLRSIADDTAVLRQEAGASEERRSLWVIFIGEWGVWTHAVLPVDDRLDMPDKESISGLCALVGSLHHGSVQFIVRAELSAT